jgi:hypothetical protein
MFRVGSLKRNSLFFSLAALTAFACGGIDEPNFFSSDGTTTTSHDSGTSSGDSGNSGFTDSGTTPFDSGTIIPDSGTLPPPDPGIFCGTDDLNNPVYCNGDICCASGDQLGTPTFACTTESACSASSLGGSLVIPCDDTQECSGKICCGTFVTGTPSYYSQVRCAVTCKGADARVFCDPANGNAECAIVSTTSTCAESGALPGFHVCSM